MEVEKTMGNPNRGGATKIRYIPDATKEKISDPEFAKKLESLEKEKEDLSERVLLMEEKFSALEEFVGAKQEDEEPKDKAKKPK